jgi:hypothetical protein
MLALEEKQPIPSPTKSILMTPGAAASRRKQVSFGEGVIENEGATAATSRTRSGLPSNYPGKFPSPWTVKKTDRRSRGKSSLTQTLLNVREEDGVETIPKERFGNLDHVEPVTAQQQPASVWDQASTREQDETINMDEPRSKSGRYWKAEYEQFESKSSREVKKLIQYRHIAKSFAKKKDEEAMRLAEKLKQEEAKVKQMEREITEMTVKMLGENDQGGVVTDGEELVKTLAKQTALTLQYKHKVDKLREEMKAHNVLDDGSGEGDEGIEQTSRRSQITQKELEYAQKKILQLTAENGEMQKLQVLAKATESKASALARDNEILKTSLSRVKEEMSRYDERRKAKEERFKQRENKLEARNQEYRLQIEKMTQDRQDVENKLHEGFEKEKEQLLARIHELQNPTTTPKTDLQPPGQHDINIQAPRPHSPKGSRPGEALIDIWTTDEGDTDLPMEDAPQDKADMWNLAPMEATSSLNMVYDRPRILKSPHIPPSSPPILPSAEPSLLHVNRRATYSPRPSMVNFSSPAKFSTYRAPRQTITSRQIEHSGNSSVLPINRASSVGGQTRKGLPADRVASAKARLEQRKEQKRLKEQGKENVDGLVFLAVS